MCRSSWLCNAADCFSRRRHQRRSITITVRLLPSPCGLQALLKIGIFCCPVEFAVNLRWVTIYFSIVTRPAFKEIDFDVHPCCLLACLYKFLHRSTWKQKSQKKGGRNIRSNSDFRGTSLSHKTTDCNQHNIHLVYPTFSSPNIIDSNFIGHCLLKCFHMCINQVSDVDVVTYTSAIRCAIICSFNLQNIQG